MTLWKKLRRLVIGPPKDPTQAGIFHRLSLVAFLAWVGLGADGLSSSSYGPEETFRQLGEHRGLAVFLAFAMAATVFIIGYAYSRVIENFPSGGGGYLVASKVLGPRIGVVSGGALLVDYVLTIAISIAAGADAIFSLLPLSCQPYELPVAFFGILFLTVLNLRGVKESVLVIAPVFALFLLTHAILLGAAIGGHLLEVPEVSREVHAGISQSLGTLGLFGVLKILMHAYSLGGGTYTGIEAVSNGLGIMREPRVETAKKTMLLMATSLAITSSGLLLSYLLWHARPVEGQTMNAVLLERVSRDWSIGGVAVGGAFTAIALISEGALLFVAAQAGFLDGPRVMANLAVDSWLPHRFSALSERLTIRNGIKLMGLAALIALVYTLGQVSQLVVLYAINVFLTFSLTQISMIVFWIRRRRDEASWKRHLPVHVVGAALCLLILTVTVTQKFAEGAWLTLAVTLLLVGFCFAVKAHYERVSRATRRVDDELPGPEARPDIYPIPEVAGARPAPNPREPVAILFVASYSGVGRHALLTLLRMFPGHFKSVVFASVAVVDSDVFKGPSEIPALEERTRESLQAYERFAAALGLSCASEHSVGTEVPAEAEKLARALVKRYPRALVVGGQLVFEEDTAWRRLLHNETAFQIQRRLQRIGIPMVVLSVQLDLRKGRQRVPLRREESVCDVTTTG